MTKEDPTIDDGVRHRLLFACLGNICRSPMAEGVFRRLIQDQGFEDLFVIDSVGMGDWHKGEAPDPRAQKAALSRGADISGLSSRKIELEDFEDFDLILAMDEANVSDMHDIVPLAHRHKIRLFLSYAPERDEMEVPDPYYGGEAGFDHALDLIEAASNGLLADLTRDGAAAPKG